MEKPKPTPGSNASVPEATLPDPPQHLDASSSPPPCTPNPRRANRFPPDGRGNLQFPVHGKGGQATYSFQYTEAEDAEADGMSAGCGESTAISGAAFPGKHIL